MSGPLRKSPIAWISAIALLAVASLVVALEYTPHGTRDAAASSNAAEVLSCEVGGPDAGFDVNPVIHLVRNRAVAAPRAANSIVMLNNAGYNYQSAAARDPRNALLDATAGH